MKKREYIVPQTIKVLTNIKFEVLAGSNENGGYPGGADANQAQFDDDDDFTLDGNINLWEK